MYGSAACRWCTVLYKASDVVLVDESCTEGYSPDYATPQQAHLTRMHRPGGRFHLFEIVCFSIRLSRKLFTNHNSFSTILPSHIRLLLLRNLWSQNIRRSKAEIWPTSQFVYQLGAIAKSEQVQSPIVNGPATYGAMAQGQSMKGGLDLQTPEERHQSIVNWCRAEMAETGHCTTTGEPKNPINIDSVRYMLHRKRPDDAQEITAALKV